MGCVCMPCPTWSRTRNGRGEPCEKKDEQGDEEHQEELRALRDREWEGDVMIATRQERIRLLEEEVGWGSQEENVEAARQEGGVVTDSEETSLSGSTDRELQGEIEEFHGLQRNVLGKGQGKGELRHTGVVEVP